MEFSIVFSFRKCGEVYIRNEFLKRISIGPFAITFIPIDIDDIFEMAVESHKI